MVKKRAIPDYRDYYPDVKEENKKIKKAYKYLENEWNQGNYVELESINNKAAYIFYYLYVTNNEYFKDKSFKGIRKVSERYECILKFYGESLPKLGYYASMWIVAMAKEINDREIFDKWTNYYLEHPHPSKVKTFQSNTLISLYYENKNSHVPSELFNEIIPIRSKLSDFGREFESQIENYIIQKVEYNFKKTNVNFIDLLLNVEHTTLHIPSTMNFENEETFNDSFEIYTASVNNYKVKKFIRESENEWRQLQNLPKIGEGWVHETQLLKMLQLTFKNTEVIPHAHTEFLGQQHYDAYFPKYKIACEYQGDQHFKSIKYFGGEDSLKTNQKRDARKKAISDHNDVKLIYVMPDYDPQALIDQIAKLMKIKSPVLQEVPLEEIPSINDLKKFQG